MAFVPTTSFLARSAVTGRQAFAGDAVCQSTASQNAATVTMAAWSMDKYAAMNDDARAPPPPPPTPQGSSSYWVAYRDSLKEKFSPFRGAKDTETTAKKSNAAIMAASTPYFTILSKANSGAFGAGGDPDTQIGFPPQQAADKYMAKCMVQQYKQSACPTGVYSTQCTEGSVRGAADESRVAALAAQFRMKQRSTAQKYGDFCESRRKAIQLAHGCSYEESLVTKNVVSARTFVLGKSESLGTCVRYAMDQSPEEKYFVYSIDKQYKQMSASKGTYDVMCCDGTTAGMAETKRVQALATRFRTNQLSEGKKAQMKYDSRLYARTVFRACNYETAIFENYPAAAASMRPMTARY